MANKLSSTAWHEITLNLCNEDNSVILNGILHVPDTYTKEEIEALDEFPFYVLSYSEKSLLETLDKLRSECSDIEYNHGRLDIDLDVYTIHLKELERTKCNFLKYSADFTMSVRANTDGLEHAIKKSFISRLENKHIFIM